MYALGESNGRARTTESNEWVEMNAVFAGQDARLYGRRDACRYALRVFPREQWGGRANAVFSFKAAPMRVLEMVRRAAQPELLEYS